MSHTHRNPAVRALLQMTHEEIQSFTHDQVIGKLGFNDLLTPQEGFICRQQLQHLQKRLAEHERILQERKANRSKMYELPFTMAKKSATFQEIPAYTSTKISINSEPVPVLAQQPSIIKNLQPFSAMKEKFEAIQNNKFKQEPKSQTAPQTTSRFLSILGPFSSMFRKSSTFHQKRKSSQEFMVDEQRKALIFGDQEDTRSSYKEKKKC